MKLKPPFGIYGGANKFFQPSPTGNRFWGAMGHGPMGFSMYAMEDSGEGSEAGILGGYPQLQSRGALQLGGDGHLYLSGAPSDGMPVEAYAIPGYVPYPSAGGDTKALEARITALEAELARVKAALS